jgi:hypothetical protein
MWYTLWQGQGCGNLPDDAVKFNVKKEHYQLSQTGEGTFSFKPAGAENSW